MSNKGLTLIELLVVIIIVGILATVGFTYYQGIAERSRTSEAKNALWEIRIAWGQSVMNSRRAPVTLSDIGLDLSVNGTGFPSNCRRERWFKYDIETSGSSPLAIATRCTAGGKAPNGPSYRVTIDLNNGTWGGTPGRY